ncbi:hypothetical protein H5410_021799 [Solanum commersonii]|uniref:Uncharacterized protein n=1 Tax=Solanum commersonii TaxID=4109 RepID=A0A9J5ZI64_SOLCO|nr:hypothetical protein H5410_021799 [Solanum commersonii]
MKDLEVRAQIINKISSASIQKKKDHISEEIPTKDGSYTMAEIKSLLLERRKLISSPTTISDLKEEINNLKEDIVCLKEKNDVIEVRLDVIQSLQDVGNTSHSSSSLEGENNSLDFMKNNKTDFLHSLKAFTSQNFIKQEINSIEIDHILRNPKLQEKINILRANSSSLTTGTGGIDTNHPMYKEFMDFIKSKRESDNNPPTYSTILMNDENIEVFDLNDKREVILLLENNDLRWKNEPWQVMSRYLDTVSYTTTVYKCIMHYEIILSAIGSCEFQHFYPANTKKAYNFFKMTIKKILRPKEWGMSPLREMDYIHPE